jgi:hypothetical protein
MIPRAPPFDVQPYSPPVIPAWANPRGFIGNEVDAAFMAGAVLNTLEGLIRAEPLWIGAWRQRLALQCAVAAVRLAGRNEDEAALRDSWVLRKPGDDLGPAGNILAAWKRLASRSSYVDTGMLEDIAELLDLPWNTAFAELPGRLDDLVQSGRSAPSVAALIVAEVVALRPDAELLAWWLADLVLAQRLRWPIPVPLLMSQRFNAAFRQDGGRGRIFPGEAGFDKSVSIALAQACVDANRLAAEIARRAEKLSAAVPKLRAKGAGDAIRLLLEEDAVSGGLQTPKLTRWGSRRLFERLSEFDAVRELSGRATFRVYGL